MINTVADNGTIRLGLVNDNKVTVIQFPIANYFSLFGEGGTFYLLNKRPEDANAYAVPSEYIAVQDEILNWTLTNYDVAQPGNGECQLSYYIGDVCKMSQRWRTAIGASLVSTGTVPEPTETWLDELDAIADRAEAAATRAEEAETKTPHIGSNGNWLIWDAVNEEWVDSGTSARPSFVVVGALPAEGQSGIIYLVPSADPGVENIYDEYIWVGTDYELIGTTAIDLSGYVPKTWLDGTEAVDGDLVLQADADNGNSATISGFNTTINGNDTVTVTGSDVAISASNELFATCNGDAVMEGYGGLRVEVSNDLLLYSNSGDAHLAATGDASVEADGDVNIRTSGGDVNVWADTAADIGANMEVTIHSETEGITLAGNHATFNGKNLLTEQEDTGITDTTPYNLRAEMINAIAKKPTFIGGTVAWNQLVQATDTSCTVPSGHKYISFLSGTWAVGSSSGSAFTVDGANGDKVFDLTAMFGSTIADYIYGLGSTNGVAWFRSLFPSETYAYNAGTLYSVNPEKSITKSADQSETSTYELNHPTLNGLFKLDAGNNLYADGDTYEHDGTITRKYAVVDLGSLHWTRTQSSNPSVYYFVSDANSIPCKWNGNVPQNIITTKYVSVAPATIALATSTDKVCATTSNGQVRIRDDAYSDATTFTAALNGQKMVYELTTPITETAATFDEKETVYQGGTEALTDYAYEQGTRDVAIPVGHSTVYLRNMIMVPAPPVLNGTYTLTATVNNGSTVIDWQ